MPLQLVKERHKCCGICSLYKGPSKKGRRLVVIDPPGTTKHLQHQIDYACAFSLSRSIYPWCCEKLGRFRVPGY